MIYKPIQSDKPDKKFYIITSKGKRVYFGASNYQHFTEGHMDEKRKQRYLNRHKKKEDWSNPDTSGYWSAKFLWYYPTYKEAYTQIKKELIKSGYLIK